MPRMKSLSAKTKLTYFQLAMRESWTNASGRQCSRNNRITVEVLGRDSSDVVDKARVGSWVTLEGYIRSEEYQGQTIMKIRTLNIRIWEYTDAEEAAAEPRQGDG